MSTLTKLFYSFYVGYYKYTKHHLSKHNNYKHTMLITLKPHVTDPRTQLRHIHNLYTRLVDLASTDRTGMRLGREGMRITCA